MFVSVAVGQADAKSWALRTISGGVGGDGGDK
jgi:hypothetical protein